MPKKLHLVLETELLKGNANAQYLRTINTRNFNTVIMGTLYNDGDISIKDVTKCQQVPYIIQTDDSTVGGSR